MPTLTIFAGVNGAGKTTLYKHQLIIDRQITKDLLRVNPDEILQEFGGDWHSIADQCKSGKIAIERINSYLEQKVSFCWETTILSHKTVSFLKLAKEQGYQVNLYFVSLENVNLALERIKIRVNKGGHDIDPKLVENRFKSQFMHLSEALQYIDNAVFFDNTSTMKIVATYVDKQFTYVDDKTNWTQKLVESVRTV